MSDLVFAERRQGVYPHGKWPILIVDDDPGIHAITCTVLRDLVYENKTPEFISVYSRAEAEKLISSRDDIALILLDVRMEDDDSGLKLIKFIREDCGNRLVRIFLRTGHPGNSPSRQVIVDYDINDYEEKTDLTAHKLYSTVITSLRNYHDLKSLDTTRLSLTRHKNGLSKMSLATMKLFANQSFHELAINVHRQLRLLLGADSEHFSSFVAVQHRSDFRIIEAEGGFAGTAGNDPATIVGENQLTILRSLKREDRNLLVEDNVVSLYEDARKYRFLVVVSGISSVGKQEHQLLDIFASNVSVAFDNLILNREIVGTQEELIVRLSEVVETRSHDTAQHVRRVGKYCRVLAGKLNMDEAAIHELEMASVMHDIGKIGIPDEILLKPDVLTEDEFSIIKTHTTVGYEILKNSPRPLLKCAALICLQHHEHFDGNGYPSGLQGGNIHVNSRIVSICDVFDALTHGRVRRQPWDIAQAADYILQERERIFDPELVDLFLANLAIFGDINSSFPD